MLLSAPVKDLADQLWELWNAGVIPNDLAAWAVVLTMQPARASLEC